MNLWEFFRRSTSKISCGDSVNCGQGSQLVRSLSANVVKIGRRVCDIGMTPALWWNSKGVLEAKGEKVNIHRR